MTAPERDGQATARERDGRVLLYGAALALIVGLTQVRHLWAAQLLLVPLLLIVPGCLLLRALRVPGARVAAFPLYVPAASLIVLMVSGLAVALLVPLLGAVPGPVLDAVFGATFDPATPLRPGPLLAGFQLVCLALLLAGVRAPADTAVPWRSLPATGWLALPLLLPLLAAAGALRLNHGHGPAVAIAAVACGALVLAAGIALAGRLGRGRSAVLLYAVALAMMWSYALRGDLVYGFDIASEYAVAQESVTSGIWVTGPHPDAYGAMLSITVLPAELHALTGLPVVLVLKLVYPAIFAMFPVAIFHLATRFVPVGWAFAAAGFVTAQGALAQQFPALARQEIAMLLFAALCGALLDSRLPRWPKAGLLGLFGAGIVVSHYTTAYFTAAMLGGALVVQGVSWLARRPRVAPRAVVAALVPGLLAGVLWYVPITGSTANIGEFRTALSADGLRLLPGADTAGNLVAAYLRGTDVTRISTYLYSKRVVLKYRPPKASVTPAADVDDPRWTLGDAGVPAPRKLAPGVSTALDLGVLLAQQLANLLGLVGALVMALSRRSSRLVRLCGALAVPMLGALVLLRLSGTLSAAYNQSRAQLQALTLVAVAMFWLLHRVRAAALRPPRRRRRWTPVLRGLVRPVPGLAGAAVVAVFVAGSGLDNALLGGERAAHLTTRGEDCERYCMYAAELAGARWLKDAIGDSPDRLYADRYAQLRLFAELGPGRRIHTDITPHTLDKKAWVYASWTNTAVGRARSLFDNQLALYAFPTAFLEAHYDLVYTSGATKVFHR
ncbi:hypothetical protein HII36_10770 [Nonomuraea sp. NN258]|uniref:hypothetical protein n=1 Tax=Nonomuraea antri TaxID=2730852 RepID=UPI001568D75B|nr:hypothetical protein [Nonomuraea antri]NRQ32317.1 hypothetical protein [Nonomuraea antri]